MVKNKNVIPDFTIEELEERLEAISIKPLINDPNCTGCGGCCYVPFDPPDIPPCDFNPNCPNVGILPNGVAH